MTDISDKIISKYKLNEKATDGWVHFKVVRDMCGLPQVGSNSHDELEEHLNKEDYFKSPLAPGISFEVSEPIPGHGRGSHEVTPTQH